MSELQDLCNEILKDENGNEITPSCGIEKLLCCITNKLEELESDNNTTGTSDDIDGGYPDN